MEKIGRCTFGNHAKRRDAHVRRNNNARKHVWLGFRGAGGTLIVFVKRRSASGGLRGRYPRREPWRRRCKIVARVGQTPCRESPPPIGPFRPSAGSPAPPALLVGRAIPEAHTHRDPAPPEASDWRTDPLNRAWPADNLTMALSQLTVLAPEDSGSERSDTACSDASTATAPELWLGRCATEEMIRGDASPLKGGAAAAGSFASSSVASPVRGRSNSVPHAAGGGGSGGSSGGGFFGTPRPRSGSLSGGESRASRMAAQRRARMQERTALRSTASTPNMHVLSPDGTPMRAEGSSPYQGTPRFACSSTPVSPLLRPGGSPLSPMAASPLALGSASAGASPLGGVGAGGRAGGFSMMSVPAAASPSTEAPAEVKQGT